MVAIVPLLVTTFALVLTAAAADPDLLQDVCVADLTSGISTLNTFFFFFFFLPSSVIIPEVLV